MTIRITSWNCKYQAFSIASWFLRVLASSRSSCFNWILFMNSLTSKNGASKATDLEDYHFQFLLSSGIVFSRAMLKFWSDKFPLLGWLPRNRVVGIRGTLKLLEVSIEKLYAVACYLSRSQVHPDYFNSARIWTLWFYCFLASQTKLFCFWLCDSSDWSRGKNVDISHRVLGLIPDRNAQSKPVEIEMP